MTLLPRQRWCSNSDKQRPNLAVVVLVVRGAGEEEQLLLLVAKFPGLPKLVILSFLEGVVLVCKGGLGQQVDATEEELRV